MNNEEFDYESLKKKTLPQVDAIDLVRDSCSSQYFAYNWSGKRDINDALRYDGGGYVYQDGKQKSKGIELDIAATPVRGLNITGGYVYNNNKYIKASTAEGKQTQFNPENIANFWLSYKFQTNSPLKGFGLGFGVNYSDKSYYDENNTIIVPSYTIFNGSIFYDHLKWRAGIALNNIANKKYWSHSFTANPQPLRQVTANITMRF